MNITNLPILLEIALKDRFACQLLCQASKAFHNKVYRDNNGDSYYNLLFAAHGVKNWHLQCRYGNLRAIKWLHYNNIPDCTVYAMDWAACFGHLEIMEWLNTNRTEGCTTGAMNLAAENGHLDVVKWLYSNRKEYDIDFVIELAEKYSQISVVHFLRNIKN